MRSLTSIALAFAALACAANVCAGRAMLTDVLAPAPTPAAENLSNIPVTLTYADPLCIAAANITAADVELPFFGSEESPESDVLIEFTRIANNSGLSPDSNPICASSAVSLTTPCTSQFLVARSGASLFIRPRVDVYVGGASPSCSTSHCQGGVFTVEDAGGAANGTFYDRKSGEATFPVTLGTQTDVESGAELVSVTVQTPMPGLSCTLLYSAPAGSLEELLAA